MKESYKKLKLCPCDKSMKKYTLCVVICKKIWAQTKKDSEQQFAKGTNIHSNPLPSPKPMKSEKSAGKFLWSIGGMASAQEATK